MSVEAHDEGMVDPIIPMQQYDQEGNPHLLVGEELFGIDGWSLGPRPGPRWWPRRRGPTVAPVDPARPRLPPHDPEPGGAGDAAPPALRELLQLPGPGGRPGRQLDLAGQADHDYVTPAEVYRRHEVVPPPVVIQRRSTPRGP